MFFLGLCLGVLRSFVVRRGRVCDSLGFVPMGCAIGQVHLWVLCLDEMLLCRSLCCRNMFPLYVDLFSENSLVWYKAIGVG